MHHLPQHHFPLSSHEAFSSLVDVAVQQPLLPVPKDDKRPNVAVNDHPQSTHHDMRYHNAAMAAAHEQMAMHQMHQQQLRQQAELQRRHQHQTTNYQMVERERQQFQVCGVDTRKYRFMFESQ